MHHFQFDKLTWATERQLLPVFIIAVLAYCILVAMFLFLSRPRNLTYARKSHTHSRFNGPVVRNSILQRFRAKTHSYTLYGRDRHIPEPTNEARISAIASDIDRYANRNTFDARSIDYDRTILAYGEYKRLSR